MKKSNVRVAALVVLFLFISSTIPFPIYKLPNSEIGSLAGFFFSPEPTSLVALYVDNRVDLIITFDPGAPGLDAGLGNSSFGPAHRPAAGDFYFEQAEAVQDECLGD